MGFPDVRDKQKTHRRRLMRQKSLQGTSRYRIPRSYGSFRRRISCEGTISGWPVRRCPDPAWGTNRGFIPPVSCPSYIIHPLGTIQYICGIPIIQYGSGRVVSTSLEAIAYGGFFRITESEKVQG